MESVNGLDQVYGTLHCGTDPGGVCDETNGLGSTIPCSGSTCQGNFHTYAIEVNTKTNPQTLTWTLDGVAYQTLNNNTLGAAVWKAAVLDAKFVLLNLVSLSEVPVTCKAETNSMQAVGGGWPGNPNSATVSGTPMKVDYVAVYYG